MATAEGNDPTVARLLEDLLDGAEAVDGGDFTLDAAEAARKRQLFQYEDRSRYLVPILEGLLGLGAAEIRVSALGFDFDIRAQGAGGGVDEDTFGRLFAAAGSHGHDAIDHALGRLAVGVDMALGHPRVKEVVVVFTGDGTQLLGEFERGKAPRRFRKGVGRGPAGVRVLVDRNWGLGRSAGEGEASDELDRLRAAVRHASTPVTVRGRKISGVERSWDYADDREEEGFRIQLGLARAGVEPSTTEIWSNGIWVDTVPGEGVGVGAVLHVPQPKYDVSRTSVVRTPVVEAGLEEIVRARRSALRQLEQDDEAWSAKTWHDREDRPFHWEVDRVDAVLGQREIRTPPKFRTKRGRVKAAVLSVLTGLAAVGVSTTLADYLRVGAFVRGTIGIGFAFTLLGISGHLAGQAAGGDESRMGERVTMIVVMVLFGACFGLMCLMIIMGPLGAELPPRR